MTPEGMAAIETERAFRQQLSRAEKAEGLVRELEAEVTGLRELTADVDRLTGANIRLEARVRELEAELADVRTALEVTTTSCERRGVKLVAAEQKLADANALIAAIRAEVDAVNGAYKHPDQLEQAVCKAFDNIRAHLAAQPAAPEPKPVPMVLHCPECRTRHIDEGEFATKSHHTHSCQGCGLTWRPAVVPTVGVRFLPGFKSAEPAAPSRTESEPVECESCAMRGRECDGGDHCDNCGARMDGNIAATADVCHDCWVRTAAEQTVLDAVGSIPERELRSSGNWYGWAKPIGEAELARRGLK